MEIAQDHSNRGKKRQQRNTECWSGIESGAIGANPVDNRIAMRIQPVKVGLKIAVDGSVQIIIDIAGSLGGDLGDQGIKLQSRWTKNISLYYMIYF